MAADEPFLADLLAGRTPSRWPTARADHRGGGKFLAPLDPVSARGRATSLFGFEYIWEIYKPVERRRWGAYTLPVLWGDRLVARFDARMDRPTATLVVNGVWLEEESLAKDEGFVEAFGRGMDRLARFLEAGRIDVEAVPQRTIRAALSRASGQTSARVVNGDTGGRRTRP